MSDVGRTRFEVLRLPVSAIDDEAIRWDMFIGSVGYEQRADHAARRLLGRVERMVAGNFDRNQVLNYDKNLKFFAGEGEVIGDGTYVVDLARSTVAARRAADEKPGPPGPLRVAVDVSSMTRQRIGDTLRVLREHAPVHVDWLYSPAKFSRSLLDLGPVRFNDAIAGYEGWGDPATSLAVVVGLGFEGDRVLGVLDELEPNETYLFEPGELSREYDDRIQRLNQALIDAVDQSRVFHYKVADPFVTFLRLSALVDELTLHGRVVLLPLGPKMFAVMCALLGAADGRHVTVWRLSADGGGIPGDRKALGPVLGLSSRFGG